nr:microfibril-associated glycoprotein 4-like isoform X2 [Styela clava]
MIAQAIFLSLVVGLVIFGLVINTQLQSEMRIMKEQLARQGDQSFARLKWLEQNASDVINFRLNEHQIRINQSVEDISSLDHSHQQFMKSVIQELILRDCTTVNRKYAKIQNTTGGVFDIYPDSRTKPVEVYCDIVTEGGGWIVFQRRMDGTEDFYRGWNDYVNGFGENDKEMWLGLETIYQLTKKASYELRVDLEDFNGNTVYAKYGTFSISSATDKYRLTVRGYSGSAGDSLAYHNNMQFSTKDSDNDRGSWGSCAIAWSGAWWYNNCHKSNLNGIFYQDGRDNTHSVNWYHWKFNRQSLRFSEMKFRKKT